MEDRTGGQQNRNQKTRYNNLATAQEPPTQQLRLRMKIMLGTECKIKTFNIRASKKLGVRDEVERWMKHEDIQPLTPTDTRANQNTRETRKQHTWFWAGERRKGRNYCRYSCSNTKQISPKYKRYRTSLRQTHIHHLKKGSLPAPGVDVWAPVTSGAAHTGLTDGTRGTLRTIACNAT